MMNLDVRMHAGQVLVYMHIDLNTSHIVGPTESQEQGEIFCVMTTVLHIMTM